MRDVTLYRHEDGKARYVAWVDRDHPTVNETCPQGAKITIFTTMPHDWVAYVRNKTEDEVNEILSSLVPVCQTPK